MNIYVNGDSFPAGFELADTVLPSFPGLQTKMFTNNPHFKKWEMERKAEGSRYYGNLELLEKAGKDLAWPAELTKIDSNITIYNGAKAGASIAGISNRTINDLVSYKNNNIKFDYVFIQLTTTDRYEFYDTNVRNLGCIQDGGATNISNLTLDKQRQYASLFFQVHSDMDLAVKYLYTVSTLKYAIKGLTDIEPIFLISSKFFISQVKRLLEKVYLKNLIDDSKLLEMILEESMEHVQILNNYLYLPLGHYEQRTHQAYARLIYDRYIAK
jgi:hypothetical protein